MNANACGAGVEEFDGERAIAHAVRLADELIQALFADTTPSPFASMSTPRSCPGRLAVERHAKADRLAGFARSEHEVQVARMEPEA